VNKSRLVVGVDVGKDELVVAVEQSKPRVFGTSTAEVGRLARWLIKLGDGRPVHVGMEATGVYSRGIAAALSRRRQFTVSVINPVQIKAFGRAMLRRTKTDQVDAQVIREFVRSQTPAAWTPPPVVRQQLSSLVTHADAIRREIRQWKNRRHAQQHDINVPKTVIDSTTAIIRSLERQQNRLEQAIARLCDTDTLLREDLELLTSIGGIADRSATQILAYAGDSLTTRSRRQLNAHAGLAPSERQSGTSVRGKSHLAKQGNVRLRRSLYMPTLVAVRFNPTIKRFYQRLVEHGKAKKPALIACMRKLLNIIRAVLIKRQTFDPNYQPLT